MIGNNSKFRKPRLFVYAFIVLVGCFMTGCNSQAKKKDSQSEITPNDQTAEAQSGSMDSTVFDDPDFNKAPLQKEIARVAMSLHNWCIPIMLDWGNETPISADVVEGNNGNCVLDYSKYFGELRKLGTISEDFLISEKERTKACAAFLSTVKWSEFQHAEAYDYIEMCPEFYFMYFTQSQDHYDGVEVEKMDQISSTEWKVTLLLYNDFDERTYNYSNKPIITVEKEGDNWRITHLKWSNK